MRWVSKPVYVKGYYICHFQFREKEKIAQLFSSIQNYILKIWAEMVWYLKRYDKKCLNKLWKKWKANMILDVTLSFGILEWNMKLERGGSFRFAFQFDVSRPKPQTWNPPPFIRYTLLRNIHMWVRKFIFFTVQLQLCAHSPFAVMGT